MRLANRALGALLSLAVRFPSARLIDCWPLG